MHLLRAAFVIVLFLAICACSQRAPAPVPSAALAAYVEADFASLEQPAYMTAVTDLAQALGRGLEADPDQRLVGPQAVLAMPRGRSVLVAVTGDRDLTMSLFAADDTLLWDRRLDLGQGFALAESGVLTHGDFTAVAITLRGTTEKGCPQRHVWVPATSGPLLVRVDDGDFGLLNTRLASDHPKLIAADQGRLDSTEVPQQLAALVALSDPDLAGRRGSPSVVSHLEKLAAATDIWVAQAAAEVLTLPRE